MNRKIIVINHIRKLRFNANEMKQIELAEKAGISRQTVIALEGGNYNPTLELACSIADVFGVSLGEVFEYKVEEEKQ